MVNIARSGSANVRRSNLVAFVAYITFSCHRNYTQLNKILEMTGGKPMIAPVVRVVFGYMQPVEYTDNENEKL